MSNCWTITVTGKQVFYDAENTEANINIFDIGHALSLIRRWGGMSLQPYTVAEHSIFVANYLELQGYSPEVCLLGLTHDATEAYIGDLVTPIKRNMKEFRDLELKMAKDITKVLKLPYPGLQDLPDVVHKADGIAMATEFRDLMYANDYWQPDKYEPFGETIIPMIDHKHIYFKFINKYFNILGKITS